MTIRPATIQDLPAVHALLAANDLLVDGVDYSDFSPPLLVAVKDGVIVGMIHAVIGKPYAIVTELAIAPAEHRKGYGVTLLRAMELLVRSMGITACAAYVGGGRISVIQQISREGWTAPGVGQMFVRSLT